MDSRCREPLTPREKHVLRLVMSGYANKEIARTIHVSENTVKFHLKNVYSKIGANHRAHAVAIAAGMGIFAPVMAPPASLAA
jgi:LuxR family maltose regulon positive regulatory protein